MNEPMSVLRGCLRMIDSQEEPHRTINFNAARDELNRYQGGCPCEQLARQHGGATKVATMVFHGQCSDFAQVETMRDGEALAGQGKTVAEAIKDLHD
jgi:hypothetical protein